MNAFLQDKSNVALVAVFGVAVGAGMAVPDWLLNILMISFSRALAVLGLLVLWRMGLVSFGHALYYGLGAYTVAMLATFYGITEIAVTLPAAMLLSGLVGFVLGFIVRRYREIFFAMLCLAFSMVLYGILVKSETLGSTDGFSVPQPTFFGWHPADPLAGKRVLYFILCGVGFVAAALVNRYLGSVLGSLTTPIRDNEIRVEYLGISAAVAVHVKFVISAVLAGLGGALLALSLGQVDPDSMVNWPISGELVFTTVLSGAGSVAAPFLGSFVFELIRTYAFEWLPHSWQLLVGATLLFIIFFLPGGIWSLLKRKSKGANR